MLPQVCRGVAADLEAVEQAGCLSAVAGLILFNCCLCPHARALHMMALVAAGFDADFPALAAKGFDAPLPLTAWRQRPDAIRHQC